MATLSLINFPKFSGSKEFLKIGRSEVCVWGGVAKGETIKLLRAVYIYKPFKDHGIPRTFRTLSKNKYKNHYVYENIGNTKLVRLPLDLYIRNMLRGLRVAKILGFF